jgi:hypothetical protein
MTAYANQKALLINRLTTRTYGGTVSVAAGGTNLIAAAVAAITDASASKIYKIQLADGTYTETPTAVAWNADTVYAVGTYVTDSGKAYICIAAHDSGDIADFATALAAAKWAQVSANTTLTGGVNLTYTGKQYIDIVGTGPAVCVIQCGVVSKDTVYSGGCNNLIQGVTISHTAVTGAAYALHLDSNPIGDESAQQCVCYNCIFTSVTKNAVGIGVRNWQRYFFVDCTMTSTWASTGGSGFYAHSMDEEAAGGRVVVVGGSSTGGNGAYITSCGSLGMPQFLFSGVTFTATLNACADLLHVGGRCMLNGAGTIPNGSHTWDEAYAASKQLLYQGVFNSKPWYYNDWTAWDAAIGIYTIYWSVKLGGWCLYSSLSYTNAIYSRPDYFEAGLAAVGPGAWAPSTAYTVGVSVVTNGGVTYVCRVTHNSAAEAFADALAAFKWQQVSSYFSCANTGWSLNLPVPMTGVGTGYAGQAPSIVPGRTVTDYLGFADESVIMLDTGDGACTFTNTAGAQTSVTAKKGSGYLNPSNTISVSNGPTLALGWLTTAFDPAYPAASDVVFGVDRGDGTTGTLGVPMLNIE